MIDFFANWLCEFDCELADNLELQVLMRIDLNIYDMSINLVIFMEFLRTHFFGLYRNTCFSTLNMLSITDV